MVNLLYELTLRNSLSNKAVIQQFLPFEGFRENVESVQLTLSQAIISWMFEVSLLMQGREIWCVLTQISGWISLAFYEEMSFVSLRKWKLNWKLWLSDFAEWPKGRTTKALFIILYF